MQKTIKKEEEKILILKILVLVLFVIIGYLYYSNRFDLNQNEQSSDVGGRVPVFHGPTGLAPSSLDRPVQEPGSDDTSGKGSTTPSTLNQPVSNSNISGGPTGSPSVNGPTELPPGTLE